MANPSRFVEEEIRRAREEGDAEPSDDALIEESVRWVKPATENPPTPTIQHAFEDTLAEEGPEGDVARFKVKAVTEPEKTIAGIQQAAEEAGIAGYGQQFFISVGQFNKKNFAPMARLARTANVLNDVALQRAVGHYAPTAVHYENLEEEDQKQLATLLSGSFYQLLYDMKQAPLEGKIARARPGQRQPRAEAQELEELRQETGLTNEFLSELNTLRDLYLNSNLGAGAKQDFQAVTEELNLAHRDLLRKEGLYGYDAPLEKQEWWQTALDIFKKVLPVFDPEWVEEQLFADDMSPLERMQGILRYSGEVLLTAIPVGRVKFGAKGIWGGLKAIGFVRAAEHIVPEVALYLEEDLGLPHEVAAPLGLAGQFAAFGAGGISVEGSHQFSAAVMSMFFGDLPNVVEAVMDDEMPMFDRALAGVGGAVPLAGLWGAGMRYTVNSRASLRKGLEFNEIQRSGRTVDAEEGYYFHGTEADAATNIAANGFDAKLSARGVWMTTSEAHAKTYGEGIVRVRPAPGTRVLVLESKVNGTVVNEAMRRSGEEIGTRRAAGEDFEPSKVLDRHMVEVANEYGYDAIETQTAAQAAKGTRSLAVFKPENVHVEGRPLPGMPEVSELVPEVRGAGTDDLPGLRGWEDPADFELTRSVEPGLTAEQALRVARDRADFWEKLAGRAAAKWPRIAGVLDWVAKGSTKLDDPVSHLLFAFDEARTSLAQRNVARADWFDNKIQDYFPNRRITEGLIELRLPDGKFYPIDEIFMGRHSRLLNSNQQALVQRWTSFNASYHKNAQLQGYRGGTYRGQLLFWPNRRLIENYDVQTGGGTKKVGAKKPGERVREFERAQENVSEHGAKYWTDIRAVLFDHLQGKAEGVLEAKLRLQLEPYTDTTNARLQRNYPDIAAAPKEATRRYNATRKEVLNELRATRGAADAQVTHWQKLVTQARVKFANEKGRVKGRKQKAEGARAGSRLARAEAALRNAEEQLAAAKRAATATPKASNTRVSADPRVVKAKADIIRAEDNLTETKNHLVNRQIETEAANIPLVEGKIISNENYRRIQRAFGREDMGWPGRLMLELSAVPRTLWAFLDHSVAMIHLGSVMMANPLAWAHIMARGSRVLIFGGRGAFENLLLNDPLFSEMTRVGLIVTRESEISRPGGRRSFTLEMAEKSPVLGHLIRASNFLFGSQGSIARGMLYKMWREPFLRAYGEGGLNRLAEHINMLTGVSKSGMGIESAAAFAPKFLRATLAMPISVFRGGAAGTAARLFWARFMATSVIMTILFNEIQDKPYNLNLKDLGLSEKDRKGRPEPFSIAIPGGGTFQTLMHYAPIARMFAHIADGDISYVPTRTGRGKLAPFWSTLVTLGTGRTFLGEKVPSPREDPAGFARFMFQEFGLPFALRQAIEDVEVQAQLEGGAITPETLLRATPKVLMEMLGGRVRPENISAARNAKLRELVLKVQEGELEVSDKVEKIINAEGAEYHTWSDAPDFVRRELLSSDTHLSALNQLSRKVQLENESKYARLIELTDQRNAEVAQAGEWLEQEYRVVNGKQIPFDESDYKEYISERIGAAREAMEEYKKTVGIEDEPLPDDAPESLRVFEQYIREVVEPSVIDGVMDWEVHEQLYNQMAKSHAGDQIGGVPVMEVVDMQLASKDDETYAAYRKDMQKVRPYFDFLDSAWSPTSPVLERTEWIDPAMAGKFRTPQEFETALHNQLSRDLGEGGDGFENWGEVMYDEDEEITFAQEFGEVPNLSVDRAESVATQLVKKVMGDFYDLRDGVKEWWLKNKGQDLLPILQRWKLVRVGKDLYETLPE